MAPPTSVRKRKTDMTAFALFTTRQCSRALASQNGNGRVRVRANETYSTRGARLLERQSRSRAKRRTPTQLPVARAA